jgi:hypothetical protein
MKRTLINFGISAVNLFDPTHLQAHEVKLLDKCPPRGTCGAIEINVAKRNQQDNISDKANRKIEKNCEEVSKNL